jgi:hypothetical protein
MEICVLQMATLVAVMLPSVRPPASTAAAGAALGVLAWSFLLDTAWLVSHRRKQVP